MFVKRRYELNNMNIMNINIDHGATCIKLDLVESEKFSA